jgi:hypothetical protein
VDEPCEKCQAREAGTQLNPEALARLASILGHLPEVFAKQRDIETHTHERSIIGRQNLNEAFAHVGTLFLKAPDLNRDQQMEQLAHLEDHLRRVMMENFEQEVYAELGDIWEQEPRKGVGTLYEAKAAALIRSGKIHGHIHPDEVKKQNERISARVIEARRAKVADGDWGVWQDASDELKLAGKEAESLKKELGTAVDAAQAFETNKNRWVAGIVIGVAIAATRFIG